MNTPVIQIPTKNVLKTIPPFLLVSSSEEKLYNNAPNPIEEYITDKISIDIFCCEVTFLISKKLKIIVNPIIEINIMNNIL